MNFLYFDKPERNEVLIVTNNQHPAFLVNSLLMINLVATLTGSHSMFRAENDGSEQQTEDNLLFRSSDLKSILFLRSKHSLDLILKYCKCMQKKESTVHSTENLFFIQKKPCR